jgi:hypothetical protein
MSTIFLIDHEDGSPHEDWDVPRGVFFWVIDFIADHVRDDEVAASLKDFLKGGYAYFALSFFTTEQAAEIVRVIREELKEAVDAEFPSTEDKNEGWQWMTADLIDKAGRWDRSS